MKNKYLIGFASLLAVSCTYVADPGAMEPVPVAFAHSDAAALSAAEVNAAARIRADVAWLADDARAGREAGTPGYDAAADYVAARMAGMGLDPVGTNNSWYQTVPLRAAQADVDAAALSITAPDGTVTTLTNLEDFRVFSSLIEETVTFENAPVVFVGFGVHAPDEGYDDLAGLDLDGKIVANFGGAPDTFDSEKRAHYSGVKSKTWSERGAIGSIALRSEQSVARTPWERLVANPTRKSMTWLWPDGRPEVTAPGIKGGAILHEDRSELLFAGAPKTFAEVRAEADAEGVSPAPFDLPATISLNAASTFSASESDNVAGVIRGADPALRDEYVVLTAHLDHTGINEKLVADGKDGINNGAIDNALGIAVMLDVGRALAETPPARSVILLAVTAEEKGLLGADYYAHFPTVPADAIVANVNLDMPVMLHEFEDVVAFGAERSSLGPITRAAVASAGLTLSPDPLPEQGIFTRSDHYRFVEKGVPAVYLLPGFANGGGEKFNEFLKEHYHKPSDEIDLPIRFKDVARFADVNAQIARDIANADARPTWNEGDFFGDLFAGE